VQTRNGESWHRHRVFRYTLQVATWLRSGRSCLHVHPLCLLGLAFRVEGLGYFVQALL